MQYNTEFGQCLSILGSDLALGSWNFQNSKKLEWNQGNKWTATVRFNSIQDYEVQYKYALIDEHSKKVIRWEDGQNRSIFIKFHSTESYTCDDLWNYRKVQFLLNQTLQTFQQMYILYSQSDLNFFNQSNKPRIMKKKLVQVPARKLDFQNYYCFIVLMSVHQPTIMYCYAIYDKHQKKFFYERNHMRSYDLASIINVKPLKQQPQLNKYAFNKNLRQSPIQNSVNQAYITQYESTIMVFDSEFHNRFEIYQIRPNLILGTFPNNEREVVEISNMNIKAVLNINQLAEFSANSSNWQVVTEAYPKHNIELVDYHLASINQKTEYNRCVGNMGNIQNQAAPPSPESVLQEMLQHYQKVLVHCTFGKKESLYVTINYLCQYQNFTIDAVLKFINISAIDSTFNVIEFLQQNVHLLKNISQRSQKDKTRSMRSKSNRKMRNNLSNSCENIIFENQKENIEYQHQHQKTSHWQPPIKARSLEQLNCPINNTKIMLRKYT